MKFSSILFLFIFLVSALQAQLTKYNESCNSVHLFNKGKRESFTVCSADLKVKPRDEKTYYWYSRESIHSSVGGYSGRLLHGAYSRFDAGGQLLERGYHKRGLRSGTWKSWSATGKPTEISSWKKGVRHGPTLYFDKNGNLLLQANYRRGKLNGKIKCYSGDASSCKFRNGKEQTETGRLKSMFRWKR